MLTSTDYKKADPRNDLADTGVCEESTTRIYMSIRQTIFFAVFATALVALLLPLMIKKGFDFSDGRLIIVYVVFALAAASLLNAPFFVIRIAKRNRIGPEISISKEGIEIHKKDIAVGWHEIEKIKTFSMSGVHQIQLFIKQEFKERISSFEPRANGGSVSIGPVAIVINTKILAISRKRLHFLIERLSSKAIR